MKNKTPKWQKLLTAKERKHIAETTQRSTLKEFITNRTAQEKENLEHNNEMCWECRFIAKKLGIHEKILKSIGGL